MKKLLLALIALSAGAGVVHTARQSTTRLEQEAKVLRDSWQAHSQTVASAQTDLAGVNEHIKELKQSLRRSSSATDTGLWSALQTNRADRLPPELRERLREELGFDWQFAPDFIVVSKQTVRDLSMRVIGPSDELNDVTLTALAITPEEHSRLEAAMQWVETKFKDWVMANVERAEPKDDVLAHYSLPGDPTMSQSISNNFASALSEALGAERAEIILASARDWMVNSIGLYDCVRQPQVVIVRRYVAGTQQRLKFQIENDNGRGVTVSYDLPSEPQWNFPRAFRPIFPEGWADMAKREGFELPAPPEKK